MKLSWVFFAGSIGLFVAGVADSGEKGNGHRHSNKHYVLVSGHSKERHGHLRHRVDRSEHKRKKHYRHRRHGDFATGFALGAATASSFGRSYNYCPDRRRSRVHYESNRYGECFRVESRRGWRDVYVEVPRRHCF